MLLFICFLFTRACGKDFAKFLKLTFALVWGWGLLFFGLVFEIGSHVPQSSLELVM